MVAESSAERVLQPMRAVPQGRIRLPDRARDAGPRRHRAREDRDRWIANPRRALRGAVAKNLVDTSASRSGPQDFAGAGGANKDEMGKSSNGRTIPGAPVDVQGRQFGRRRTLTRTLWCRPSGSMLLGEYASTYSLCSSTPILVAISGRSFTLLTGKRRPPLACAMSSNNPGPEISSRDN